LIQPRDAADWARELGISREAVELYLASEVIDLHLDTFIWQRIFGYDPTKRHERPPLGGWFLGHADFPRVREANLAAATWVITTNPLREGGDRLETLLRNVATFQATVAAMPDDLAFVRSHSEYLRARTSGRHAVFFGIQGGNALDSHPDAIARLPDGAILRVTLLHLSSSTLGTTSSPLRLGPDEGIGAPGRALIERLNAARILVDLAHISVNGFWAAMDAHDPRIPVVVTHTGVSGVRRHWRNLDDSQIRVVAQSGGVVGILFHAPFLGDRPWSGRSSRVVDHIEHVIRVGGEDAAAIGSDFDGFITPPRDLTSVLELPRLVEHMLVRGFTPERVQKVLGGNFLRVLREVRP